MKGIKLFGLIKCLFFNLCEFAYSHLFCYTDARSKTASIGPEEFMRNQRFLNQNANNLLGVYSEQNCALLTFENK